MAKLGRWLYWEALTTAEFVELDHTRTIALLPVAATEQHGPHLPVSVDSDILTGILQAATQIELTSVDVVVLPLQKIGCSPEHQAFAGTLSLSPAQLLSSWVALGQQIAAAGFRRMCWVNGHGGQVALLEVIACEIRRLTGMAVVSTSWFQWPLEDAEWGSLHQVFGAEEARFGIHGGAIETSIMLHLHPHRVKMAHLQAFPSTRQAWQHADLIGQGRSKWAWMAQDLHPAGVVGRADLARADVGQAVVQAAATQLARLMEQIGTLPPPPTPTPSAPIQHAR